MKRILLASQYKILLNQYKSLLMNWGFEIHATTSGNEALRLHRQDNFDLIFSDFNLEEMSGCTLCSLIRQEEQSPQVPIIIACQNIRKRIERSELSGATAVAVKPIDRIKLLEVIGDHLGLQLIRGKRVILKVFVTINNDDQEFVCFSRDISTSGILLKSDHALTLGNRIVCRFALPGSCKVEAGGEVVRYMTDLDCDNLYGIKFVSMSAGAQKAVSDYIDSCSDGNSAGKGTGRQLRVGGLK